MYVQKLIYAYILLYIMSNLYYECMKCIVQRIIPKNTCYYALKIIVHIAYDCSIRVYWSICTWCGEYVPT